MKLKRLISRMNDCYGCLNPFFTLYSYDIMTSCWSVDSHERPGFIILVSRFSNLLERDSGYLELSQSLSWKRKSNPQKSPATSVTPTLLSVKEKQRMDELAEENEMNAESDVVQLDILSGSTPLPTLSSTTYSA